MKVFHNGTAIFLPGQTHLLINPELENVEPTRLMIVNHYEAEVWCMNVDRDFFLIHYVVFMDF
jgi:hypothetical protein